MGSEMCIRDRRLIVALLTKEQLAYFEEFGFLPLSDILDPGEILDPIIREYHIVLDNSFRRSVSSTE